MSRNSRFYAMLLLLLNVPAAICFAKSEIERKYNVLYEADNAHFSEPYRERIALLSRIYAQEFSPYFVTRDGFQNISDHDLKLLFRSASLMGFYTSRDEYRENMKSLLNAMEARGIASRKHIRDMFGQLLKDRLFSDAKDFRHQHSKFDLDRVPNIQFIENPKPGDRTILAVNQQHFSLERRVIDVSRQPKIIVISHPNCHFCQAAVKDIEKHPQLAEVFFAHSRWLVPPERELNIESIQRWNQKHPEVRMDMIYSRDEWPDLDTGATPTFYFFQDGKVISKFSGWPQDGRLKDLKHGLEMLGILQDAVNHSV